MAFFGKVKPNESGRRESQHQKCPQVSFQKRKIAWSTRWRWKTELDSRCWHWRMTPFFQGSWLVSSVPGGCLLSTRCLSAKISEASIRTKVNNKKTFIDSLLGIIINHFEGPYEPSSISWNITGISSLLNRLACVFNLAQLGYWWCFRVPTSKKTPQWSRKRRCEGKTCWSLQWNDDARMIYNIPSSWGVFYISPKPIVIFKFSGGRIQSVNSASQLSALKLSKTLGFENFPKDESSISQNRSLSSETSH